mmetsp:Transcript_13617/g.55134  ORF Transcript_13617/g.55134 Transcript_13617/m.55134 type:complete len:327 (-) Transcript_13617:721-1701(-)
MATSAVMRVGAAASPGASVRRARTTTRAPCAAAWRNLERRGTTRSAGVDGAVGRSRANHVPRAISDSRTRKSTDAKSSPSSSPEFGSGALVEVDRPRGNSTTAQAMANSVNILLGVGLLSVPYALQQGGWAGLGVLGVLGVTTNYTGKILIRCQTRGSLPASDSSFGRDGRRCEVNDRGGAGAAARGVIADDADADASDAGTRCARRRRPRARDDPTGRRHRTPAPRRVHVHGRHRRDVDARPVQRRDGAAGETRARRRIRAVVVRRTRRRRRRGVRRDARARRTGRRRASHRRGARAPPGRLGSIARVEPHRMGARGGGAPRFWV